MWQFVYVKLKIMQLLAYSSLKFVQEKLNNYTWLSCHFLPNPEVLYYCSISNICISISHRRRYLMPSKYAEFSQKYCRHFHHTRTLPKWYTLKILWLIDGILHLNGKKYNIFKWDIVKSPEGILRILQCTLGKSTEELS